MIVRQYANISKSFNDVSSAENVSFPLLPGWTSKNTTIYYDGLSREKTWTINGDFLTNGDGWFYEEVDSENRFVVPTFIDWDGTPAGCLQIGLGGSGGTFRKDDYAIWTQSYSIDEALSSKNALVSADFYYNDDDNYPNISVYLGVNVNGVEKNKTIHFDNNPVNPNWGTIDFLYNPISFGQSLPGNLTVFAGMYVNEDSTMSNPAEQFHIDNIHLQFYSELNDEQLLRTYDVEFAQNHTSLNTTYGEGYTFIDAERSASTTRDIIFTFYENLTQRYSFTDFLLDEVTVFSSAVKEYNTTINNEVGSRYTLGDNITWDVEVDISNFPDEYTTWIEIEKPTDWEFYSIIDSYSIEKIGSCTGTGLGSNLLRINSEDVIAGKWKLKAISKNYISNGNIGVWNNSQFENTTRLIFDDIFHVNVSLNDSISISNTQINCTIYNPDNSIFFHESKEPSSFNLVFSNLSVGINMSVGTYKVEVIWTNNNSYSDRDQIGFLEFSFNLLHNTSLNPITSYFERLAGDPLVIYTNFTDIDINDYLGTSSGSETIATYNSTFGTNGAMVYFGSGIYGADINTNGLALGDYYFSFNISKPYYFNQTKIDLIHLKIIAQPLKLEVPTTTLNAVGNSYILCPINVTGALSSTPIWPANVSTNWQKWYNVTDHLNGTQTINFSTQDLPTSGLLENFVVTIHANKTNYGNTQETITISINPISANGSVNKTIVNAYLNQNLDIKANYTDETMGALIAGATCSITWEGGSTITPVSDEFIINLDTFGLNIDVYNALIKLEKPGYETIYLSVVVVIQNQDVNLTVAINSQVVEEDTLINLYFKESLNVSVRVFALGEQDYLSGGIVSWVSNNYDETLIEAPVTYYNTTVVMDASNFSTGINYIYLQFQKTNYSNKIFTFQAFVSEQDVNLTVIVNSVEISENTLFNHYFKETVNVSVRAYAEIEKIYLSGGIVTWTSDNYIENLTESPSTYFNTSITIDAANFSAGINYIYLQFQQENYTTKLFSFQIFVSEQEVNLTVTINSAEITQNTLTNIYFKEVLNVSVRVYAEIEKIYLSGSNLTWISDNFNRSLIEFPSTVYNGSIIMDGANFDSGINYVYIRFEQGNYTTNTFSFQLFIRAQTVNLTVEIDSVEIIENYLLEKAFNEGFNISCKAYANAEKIFLTGATITFIYSSYELNLTEYANFWQNTSITVLPSIFNLDVNYVYLRFELENYTTTTFSFQIQVEQIGIEISTLNFEGALIVNENEDIFIKIALKESTSNAPITNARLTYSWGYGLGEFTHTSEGVYVLTITPPSGLFGTFEMDLIISVPDTTYKTEQKTIFLTIQEIEKPNYFLIILVISAIGAAIIFGVMSYRSYVILPKRRREDATLLRRTQPFKDMRNLRAIVLIHKRSGLLMHSKSYSFLDEENKLLFSGFIQALVQFAESLYGDEVKDKELKAIAKGKDKGRLLDLDFKHFQCLIYDLFELRTIFILEEPPSENLKVAIKNLSNSILSECQDDIANFKGLLEDLEDKLPTVIEKNMDLSYKESQKITENRIYLTQFKESGELTNMALRVLNVISSFAKSGEKFEFSNIFELIHEKNEDLVIDAIELLRENKLILPFSTVEEHVKKHKGT